MGGGPGEPLDDAVELEAPVEAVGEAGEIGLGVLRADVVVRAGDRGLDVAQRRVHPLERRPARGALARAGRDREVRAARLLHRGPAGQAIAHHRAAGGEVPLGDPLDLLLAEALDDAQPQPSRPPLRRGLDRGHDRRLAGGTPAALAALALPAEVGVVDPDPTVELRLAGLALRHRPHQFVLPQPGRGLLDAQPPAELDRADPVLALGQMVDGREPGGERQLGVLEHRPRGEGDLPLAAVALEHLAGPEPAEAPAAAGRAGQALAPAHPKQRLAAGLLGPEALPEPGLAQPLDRASQLLRRCHTVPPTTEKLWKT